MWHYLFTIVNGSQGIILFVLFIYRRIRARKSALTSTLSGPDSQDTQQKTLTTTKTAENDGHTEPEVKQSHPAVKSVMSLPVRHSRLVIFTDTLYLILTNNGVLLKEIPG